ncbi:MAG: hypothetical protein HY647_08150 [Acidobacteria bacterium]|nr:hypothetical protein [Acidobacteriota bacterium]
MGSPKKRLQVISVLVVGGLWLAGAILIHSAEKKTLEGTISDTMCGVKHTMGGNISDAECTIKCVEMGSKYALVVGSDVYELEGKTAGLDKLAGQKAKVTGTVDGKKIQVESALKAS